MARVLFAGIRWLAALILVTAFGSGIGLADEWTTYRLGDVTFQAPANWKVARQQRDRSFILQNPKGDFELRVEWWFQDEPILGYDDIKSHKRIVVAGKPATYIYSAFSNRQTVKAVLDEKRRDGRKLLLVLESSAPDLSTISPLFDDLLARVVFGKSSAAPDRLPVGKQAEQNQVGQQQAGQTPVDAAGAKGVVLHDAAGQFALRHPAGWRKGVTERDGARTVTLSSPDGQALILVAVLPGTPKRDPGGRAEDFETFYYDNSVLPDSIEGDGDLRIGALEGRYVEMNAQIYPVEGVRLAFSKGRSWLFKSIGDDRAYIVAYLHSLSAPAPLQAALNDSVRSLRTGSEASALRGSEPASPAPATAAAPAPRPASLSHQMKSVAGLFGNDCEAVALDGWTHPTREAISKRRQAHLEWVMLCRDRKYPVYGINFDHDPQGRTNDFFYPLYDELLTRNGDAPYSFVVLRDKLIIAVSRSEKDSLSVDIRDALDLVDAPSDRGAAPSPAAKAQPAGTAAPSGGKPYLPSTDIEEVRVWVGPISFEPPSDWHLQPGDSGRLMTMTMTRPEPGAEIMVILWPAERPMPASGIKRVEYLIVAGAPATRLREVSGSVEIDHIFFDEPLADGSRLSVAYRASGEPVEDGQPLLELLLASLDRTRVPPGGPTVWMPGKPTVADPFAKLDSSELIRTSRN